VYQKAFETGRLQLLVYVLLLLFLSGARAWILYRERPAETRAEDQIILGEAELIELISRKGGETADRALAKINTGAAYSSIDEDLAEDLGIDLDDPEETVEMDSANGAARPHQGSGE
jgi:Aspartyl protease